MPIGNGVKIWVFVSVCSLLLWSLYWLPSNIQYIANLLLLKPDLAGGTMGTFTTEHVGLIARFAGAIVALVAVYRAWLATKTKTSTEIGSTIAAALFLEGVYFVLLFPPGLWMMALGVTIIGFSSLLQVAFAVPSLITLSFKIKNYAGNVQNMLKWLGITGVTYISAMWINAIFLWFDLMQVLGSNYLLRGITILAFLNSLVFMSLAVIFAIIGTSHLTKNNGAAVWWFGLSLSMVGLHYMLYLIYSYLIGSNLVLWLDVWAIPFLGLGISLLRMKPKEHVIQPPLMQ